MKRRLLFLIPILSILVPCASVLAQTGDSSQQSDLHSTTPIPKRTATDERALLTNARHGDANSQMWLGAAYEQGRFGKPNYAKALKWLTKAAEQGNPDAQAELGQMYQDGEGVAENYALAAQWYKKAAEHVPNLGGAGQGRNKLGLLYLQGQGVPQSYVQAYLWFSVAFPSNPNLPYAKAHMTPEQILEAERLVADWKSQHPDPAAN
jgi:TPR repeat protein